MDRLSYYVNYYVNDFWHVHGDPRVEIMPLFGGGPWKVTALCLCYLLFVKVVGPAYMKNREPYDLRAFMLLYNGFLIGFNMIGGVVGFWATRYGVDAWKCEGMDQNSTDFMENLLVYFAWLYFASKVADFVDTIVFVLRKKTGQASFLHVFHHGVMPLIAYFGIKFHPGGYSSFLPITNLFIHAAMYSYYAIAAAGPEYKKHLWWKQHVTLCQIVQFILTLAHSFKALIVPNCWPKWLACCEAIHAGLFLYMFTSFYIQAYCKPKAPIVTQIGNDTQAASKKRKRN